MRTVERMAAKMVGRMVENLVDLLDSNSVSLLVSPLGVWMVSLTVILLD